MVSANYTSISLTQCKLPDVMKRIPGSVKTRLTTLSVSTSAARSSSLADVLRYFTVSADNEFSSTTKPFTSGSVVNYNNNCESFINTITRL